MKVEMNQETVCASIENIWAGARQYDDDGAWGVIRDEINGMQSLLIYGALHKHDPEYNELKDDLRLLWKIALRPG